VSIGATDSAGCSTNTNSPHSDTRCWSDTAAVSGGARLYTPQGAIARGADSIASPKLATTGAQRPNLDQGNANRISGTHTVSEAVKRGVHISAQVPTGYRCDEHGRLVRQEPAASVVAECFRRRALGASWAELARFLDEKEVYPATGNKHWSKPGVTSMISNPVYMGQARSGKHVKEKAHEPLVTRAEFDAAQGTRTLLKQRDGSLASQALLGGLIRCAGCGHTLKITGHTDRKTGKRYPSYYCTGRYASGLCSARAHIRASTVDRYVEEQVLKALRSEGGPLAQARAADAELETAAQAVTEAEHELDQFLANPKLLTIRGEAKFTEAVEVRQRALEEARERFSEVGTQPTLLHDLSDGDLLAAWPTLSTQEKRRLLHGLLERVVLRRAGARGRLAPPIAKRTQIVLRGGVTLEPDSEKAATGA
jgi:Recombinase zinc beta ribbon domain/Recombinase